MFNLTKEESELMGKIVNRKTYNSGRLGENVFALATKNFKGIR